VKHALHAGFFAGQEDGCSWPAAAVLGIGAYPATGRGQPTGQVAPDVPVVNLIPVLVAAFSLAAIAAALLSRDCGGSISLVGVAQVALIVVGAVDAIARALPIQRKPDETFLSSMRDHRWRSVANRHRHRAAEASFSQSIQKWTTAIGILHVNLSETEDPERMQRRAQAV
jgi:hypothetical protein